MIADEKNNAEQHKMSIKPITVQVLIRNILQDTVQFFVSDLQANWYIKSLNEDDLTQIFIAKAQILLRTKDYPFNVCGQYRDLTEGSKGFSDFWFYANDITSSVKSIYSVECKRLPAPEKSREREYVIGKKNNGGIERYKTEMHGAGLGECGILAFVEKDSPRTWVKTINGWIGEQSQSDLNWSETEVLQNEIHNSQYSTFESTSSRKSLSFINLFHIHISLN